MIRALALNCTLKPSPAPSSTEKLAGEVLVDTLLRLIRGDDAHSAMLSAQVVVRKSCGGG